MKVSSPWLGLGFGAVARPPVGDTTKLKIITLQDGSLVTSRSFLRSRARRYIQPLSVSGPVGSQIIVDTNLICFENRHGRPGSCDKVPI